MRNARHGRPGGAQKGLPGLDVQVSGRYVSFVSASVVFVDALQEDAVSSRAGRVCQAKTFTRLPPS